MDELDTVGPGDQFLGTPATFKHYREFWFPKLLDRKIRPQWLEAGATTLGQRLNAKVRHILKEHRPSPLAPDKKEKVHAILATAMGEPVAQ